MACTASKTLVKKHYDESEFKSVSVLNDGVTLENVMKNVNLKGNLVKVRSKYRRPKKYK